MFCDASHCVSSSSTATQLGQGLRRTLVGSATQRAAVAGAGGGRGGAEGLAGVAGEGRAGEEEGDYLLDGVLETRAAAEKWQQQAVQQELKDMKLQVKHYTAGT